MISKPLILATAFLVLGTAASAETADRPTATANAEEGIYHPSALLDLLNLQPGQSVAELIPSSEYWPSVMRGRVGASGEVAVYAGNEMLRAWKGDAAIAEWDALARSDPTVHRVRTGHRQDLPAAPASLDRILIFGGYHEIYFASAALGIERGEPALFLSNVWRALKPGGVVVVVDYTAPSGMDPLSSVPHTGRIAADCVKQDWASAGFVLTNESPIYANSRDDRLQDKNLEKWNGKPDRLAFRFVKPVTGTQEAPNRGR